MFPYKKATLSQMLNKHNRTEVKHNHLSQPLCIVLFISCNGCWVSALEKSSSSQENVWCLFTGINRDAWF